MADARVRVRYSAKAHLRARPLPALRRVLQHAKTLPQKPSSASHLRRSGCPLWLVRSSRRPSRHALRLRHRALPRPRPTRTQMPISRQLVVVPRVLLPSPLERSPRPQRPSRQPRRLRPRLPTSRISRRL